MGRLAVVSWSILGLKLHCPQESDFRDDTYTICHCVSDIGLLMINRSLVLTAKRYDRPEIVQLLHLENYHSSLGADLLRWRPSCR